MYATWVEGSENESSAEDSDEANSESKMGQDDGVDESDPQEPDETDSESELGQGEGNSDVEAEDDAGYFI